MYEDELMILDEYPDTYFLEIERGNRKEIEDVNIRYKEQLYNSKLIKEQATIIGYIVECPDCKKTGFIPINSMHKSYMCPNCTLRFEFSFIGTSHIWRS